MAEHPFREPTPPEPEVSEADEMIARANAKRSKRWPFFVVAAGLLSLPFLAIAVMMVMAAVHRQRAREGELLDRDGRAEVERLLVDAEKTYAKREDDWRKTMTHDALATVRPGLSRCAVRLPAVHRSTRSADRLATCIGEVESRTPETAAIAPSLREVAR